mgnify:FL=1
MDRVTTKKLIKSNLKNVVKPEELHEKIAAEAFLIAEKHDFQGDPVADWLVAESKLGEQLTLNA